MTTSHQPDSPGPGPSPAAITVALVREADGATEGHLSQIGWLQVKLAAAKLKDQLAKQPDRLTMVWSPPDHLAYNTADAIKKLWNLASLHISDRLAVPASDVRQLLNQLLLEYPQHIHVIVGTTTFIEAALKQLHGRDYHGSKQAEYHFFELMPQRFLHPDALTPEEQGLEDDEILLANGFYERVGQVIEFPTFNDLRHAFLNLDPDQAAKDEFKLQLVMDGRLVDLTFHLTNQAADNCFEGWLHNPARQYAKIWFRTDGQPWLIAIGSALDDLEGVCDG